MKKNYWKMVLRTVQRSLNRFLAIFAITALGVGFLTGLLCTAPDMKNSVDEYYDGAAFMDVNIKSTMGLTAGDLDEVRAADGVEAAEPAYAADVLVSLGGSGESGAAKVIAVDFSSIGESAVNLLTLTEGRLPERADECVQVVENPFSEYTAVGDVITLEPEEDDEDFYVNRELTVVGLVTTPLYMSTERETSTVGSGTVSYFFLVDCSEFDTDIYTDFYVTLRGAAELNTFSDAYSDLVDGEVSLLEDLGDERREVRYQDLKADAEAELADAEEEYESEKADAERELADAKAELADALQELADGEAEYARGEAELTDALQELTDGEEAYSDGEQELAAAKRQLAEAEEQLDAAEKEVAAGKRELDAGWAEYDAGEAELEEQSESVYAELDAARQTLEESRTELDAGWAEIEAQESALEEAEAELEALRETAEELQERQDSGEELSPVEKALLQKYMAGLEALTQGRTQLAAAREVLEGYEEEYQAGYAEYQAGLAEADEQFAAARAQLAAAKAELAEGEKTYNSGKAALEAAQKEYEDGLASYEEGAAELAASRKTLDDGWTAYYDGLAELQDAAQELEDGRAAYDDGLAEYEDARAEADEQFADAERELADARQEIEDMAYPKWYVLDRETNVSYYSFVSNVDKVSDIAKVFPVFFFLVAALVALTTMTRMVEEERTEIGTMKALGYGKGAVAVKYILYAGVASVLGSVAGVLLGQWIFPTIIWNAYGIMYYYSGFHTAFLAVYAVPSALAAIVSVLVATWAAVAGSLKESPALLMLPKAPKEGRRIFLEHIPLIWNRLKFTYKVTARNIFRYKKRFFMTIIGIAGCTALLVAGFGIRDSIGNIVDIQFNELQKYGLTVNLSDDASAEDGEELAERLDAQGEDFLVIYYERLTAAGAGGTEDIYVEMPSDPDRFPEFVELRDRLSKAQVEFDGDSVILTEKMADSLGVGVGDTFTLENGDGEEAEFTLTDITENYIWGYLYVGPQAWEAAWGDMPDTLTWLVKSPASTEEEENAEVEELLKYDFISSASFSSALVTTFDSMLNKIDYIVIVLILCAGLLAFVVLYNLININISERQKEIATIKVLGFYNGEVNAYIFRETFLLSIFGSLAGLVVGFFLHRFVILTVEVSNIMFGRTIKPMSYVYSVVITMIFTVLVSIVMSRRLRQISMVESLKSVD